METIMATPIAQRSELTYRIHAFETEP